VIELHPDTSKINESGTIPVTWCVPADIIRDLAKSGTPAFLILAVVAETPDGERLVTTQVEPLRAGMAFVSFHRAGINRIFAQLNITGKRGAERATQDFWRRIRHDGTDWRADESPAGIEKDIAEVEGRQPPGSMSAESLAVWQSQIGESLRRLRSQLEDARAESRFRGISAPIDVPAECFGKAWPKWVMTYLGFAWSDFGMQECDRRKRALIGIPTVWALIFVNMALRAAYVAIAYVGLGLRGTYPRVLLRPYKSDILEMFNESEFPRWLPWGDDIKDEPDSKSFARLLLAPLSALPLAISTLILWKLGWAPLPWESPLVWFFASALGIYGIFAVIAAVVLVIVLISGAFDSGFIPGLFRKLGGWMDTLFEGSAEMRDEDVVRLQCDTDGAATYAAQRVKPRTIRLRFESVKAKVCRPLQR